MHNEKNRKDRANCWRICGIIIMAVFFARCRISTNRTFTLELFVLVVIACANPFESNSHYCILCSSSGGISELSILQILWAPFVYVLLLFVYTDGHECFGFLFIEQIFDNINSVAGIFNEFVFDFEINFAWPTSDVDRIDRVLILRFVYENKFDNIISRTFYFAPTISKRVYLWPSIIIHDLTGQKKSTRNKQTSHN